MVDNYLARAVYSTEPDLGKAVIRTLSAGPDGTEGPDKLPFYPLIYSTEYTIVSLLSR